MRITTNLLISKVSRTAASALALTAAGLAGAVFFGRQSTEAAWASPPPLTDSSVSPLLSLDQAVENVAARVNPSVVNIAVTARASEEQAQEGDDGQNPFAQFFGQGDGQDAGPGDGRGPEPQRQVERAIGSGVIVSPDGYIVTNNHVVSGAMKIRVTLHDRRTYAAKLIGTDKLTDLAVIKIDASGLPAMAWGDSTQLKPGESVLAFGSPFGYFQFSVTRGIVSAVNRPNPYSDDPRKPGDFIQTDAAINPGNSGGPLVNARGELVGINTFLISNTGAFAGAGFAIPSQTVHPVVEALIKYGVVHHGYLGIGLNDVTPDNAKFFRLDKSSGAVISQVTPGSPAERAGLRVGDVITGFDGRAVNSASELQVATAECAPGSGVQLAIERNGAPRTVEVTVGEYHRNVAAAEAAAAGDGHPRLGIAVGDLTPGIRRQLELPESAQGVAVEQVQPASPAEDAGISRGDVILELNRKPVESVEQFRSEVRSLPQGQDMLLLVWSNGGASYRTVHPDRQSSGM
jgi:serine protease Do